jgi:L-malate glycosyltransferase
MSASPWGGSEFLWAKAAMYALENGHEVLLSIFSWSKNHPEILNLVSKGAKLHLRPNGIEPKVKNGILKAILKLGYQRNFFYNNFNDIIKFNPDHICISQGGSFSMMYHPPILQFLKDNHLRYSVICQYNHETGIVPFGKLGSLNHFFSNALHSFFVSQRNREVLERQIAVRLENSTIIDNPVNLSSRTKLHFPSGVTNNPQLACVARLDCNYKGQEILLQTLSAKKWNERSWTLNLYGEGPDKKYIEKLIDFYGLSDKVFLRGHVKSIDKIWKKNHILILPSIGEGTPLALIEAMSCGRIGLATDVGGVDVLVKNGVTGYLCPAPKVKYLDKSLEEAWENRNLWESMGEKAYEHVLMTVDQHPEKTLIKKILSL